MTTYDFLSAKQMILSNVWTDSTFTWFYFWYELGKIMTRYDFLDARFVIWLAIDLLLLLVNIWFWAKNDQIWQPDARWMIFCNIRTDFNFIFGQFSVARKLILNSGAIRLIGLLLDGNENKVDISIVGTNGKFFLIKAHGVLRRMGAVTEMPCFEDWKYPSDVAIHD